MEQMRAHPKLVGDISAANVMARLLEVFDAVLVPYGDNQRYDLVVEQDGAFFRVQCKTGRLRNGRIHFRTSSSTYHHPNRDRVDFSFQDYRGDADFFGVYCPETRGIYLVPVESVARRNGYLRVALTGNGQSKGVRWASAYEVHPRALPSSFSAARSDPGPREPWPAARPPEGTLFEPIARYAVG